MRSGHALRDASPFRAYAHGEVWMKYRLWTRYLRLSSSSGGHVLDLGCGPGWLCRWLARQFPELVVVGMDVSENAVRQARELVRAEYVRNAHFVVGSAVNLPFRTGALQRVISTQVWEHLPPPRNQRMLDEVCRILAEGGKFVLNVPGPLFYTYCFPVYQVTAAFMPACIARLETLRRYCTHGAYDSWGIHQHVRPGFYPWEIFAAAPWRLAPVQYSYTMKRLGALWFELTSLDRRFRGLFLPLSYLIFWLDDYLPGPGFDLTIRFTKVGHVPTHVERE